MNTPCLSPSPLVLFHQQNRLTQHSLFMLRGGQGGTRSERVSPSHQHVTQKVDPSLDRSTTAAASASSLSTTFSPTKNRNSLGPYDVIIGRGRKFENNIGNARFRVTMNLNLRRYLDAPTRQDKTIVILSVYHLLRDDIGARFVKSTGNGQYQDCDEQEARNKVAHALRDLAARHTKQSSGNSKLSRKQREKHLSKRQGW